MDSKIKLSVLIPVYKTEQFIIRCVSSVLSYPDDDVEFIIVNDGTPDKAIDVLLEAFSDPRLKILNKSNGGLSSARNAGILAAKGEYILHLDSDDYLCTNSLNVLTDMINEDSCVDVVVFDFNVVDENQTIKSVWHDSRFAEQQFFTGRQYLQQYFMGMGAPSAWNKIWRRSLYIENGIFHPVDISYGEDGATTPRLMFHAQRVIKVNRPLLNYVQHDNSMMSASKNNLTKKILDYSRAFEIVDQYFVRGDENWYLPYKDIFKLTYLYDIVSEYYHFSTQISSSSENKCFYQNYVRDLKKGHFIYPFRSRSGFKLLLVLASYRTLGVYGDFVKWLINYALALPYQYLLKKIRNYS